MVMHGKFIIAFTICLVASLYPMHKSKSDSPHNGSPNGSPKKDSPLSGSPGTIARKIKKIPSHLIADLFDAETKDVVKKLQEPIENCSNAQAQEAVDNFSKLIKHIQQKAKAQLNKGKLDE